VIVSRLVFIKSSIGNLSKQKVTMIFTTVCELSSYKFEKR